VGGWLVVQLNPGPELTDKALDDEIRLFGDLLLAASRVTRPLTQVEVDRVLNLAPPLGKPPTA
jgi:hypothetical protein